VTERAHTWFGLLAAAVLRTELNLGDGGFQMKKLFLATTAVVALTAGSARAADLGVAPIARPVVPACAQFAGVYVGGNAGWGYYDHQWADQDGWAKGDDTKLPSSVHATNNGFVGGVQGGYNWQLRCTVFGVQLDYDWAGIDSHAFNTDGDSGPHLDTLSVSSKLRGIGTLRTRTGVVVDNILLYLTGGFAFANFQRSFTIVDLGIPTPLGIGGSETLTSSKTKWGAVFGAGTEWAMWGNWSLQSEVLFALFEKDTQAFNTVLERPVLSRFELQDNVVISRIGLNYHFGAR
jgi:outer membrane immunogenic protein